jgi:hypothetical protein
MTFIGTVTVRDRECDNDTAEGIALETVRAWGLEVASLIGGIHGARDVRAWPSNDLTTRAERLGRSIRAAIHDTDTHLVGPCGFAGPEVEGEIVSGTPLGWSEQWRCPRCGQDNVQSIEGEGM